MKIILFCSIFLISLISVSANDGYKRNPNIDIINYSFSVSISDTSDIIYGHSVITAGVKGTVSDLILDFRNTGSDGKGMKVMNITCDKGPVKWIHANDKITITFSAPVVSGIVELTIDYSGIPADGLIISNNKFGKRTFFADNWPDRGHNWLPCIDHPYDKSTVDFIITSPDHYKVVGSGYLVEESSMPHHTRLTHWKEDVPLPVKVMAIGAADFATSYVGNVGNTPVWSWVFAENRSEGFNDYSVGLKPLAFYSELIGPYSFEKLANVQSKTIFGGLENAGCIFYSERSVTGKGKAENLMAHEIAHQWFGNSVTENDWHHLWLSEGFATYLTAVYQEKTYGAENLNKTMISARETVLKYYQKSQTPVIDTTAKDLMKLLNANSYQKGAWVLHMLRRKIGDENFWNGMRLFYETYRNKNVLTIDFQRIMEKTSNTDLSEFFRQWLYTTGQPELKITNRKGKKGTYEITVEQTQKNIFKFDLELQIKSSDSTWVVKIPVSDKITKKIVETDKIVEIIPDPNVNLLFSEIH
jgi:aminopeptidase N